MAKQTLNTESPVIETGDFQSATKIAYNGKIYPPNTVINMPLSEGARLGLVPIPKMVENEQIKEQ